MRCRGEHGSEHHLQGEPPGACVVDPLNVCGCHRRPASPQPPPMRLSPALHYLDILHRKTPPPKVVPSATRNLWKPAVRRAWLPIELRIHDLRHTAASLLISQGAHLEAIKRHLGHSSIVVTMDTYGHLLPSEAEALAERLDETFRSSLADNRRTEGEVIAASAQG